LANLPIEVKNRGFQPNWQPTVSVEEILNEIAAHAKLHPDWLEISVAS
jgi:hypothetical protein